jgi:hypothetical protein
MYRQTNFVTHEKIFFPDKEAASTSIYACTRRDEAMREGERDPMRHAAQLPGRQKAGEDSAKQRRENRQTVRYHASARARACHLIRVATPSNLPNTHRK